MLPTKALFFLSKFLYKFHPVICVLITSHNNSIKATTTSFKNTLNLAYLPRGYSGYITINSKEHNQIFAQHNRSGYFYLSVSLGVVRYDMLKHVRLNFPNRAPGNSVCVHICVSSFYGKSTFLGATQQCKFIFYVRCVQILECLPSFNMFHVQVNLIQTRLKLDLLYLLLCCACN